MARVERVYEDGHYHWVLRGVIGPMAGMPMGHSQREAERNLANLLAAQSAATVAPAAPPCLPVHDEARPKETT